MKMMNITSTPTAGTFQSWSRVARRIVAIGALAVGISSASAQSFGVSTLAGQPNSPAFADGTGGAARFNNPAGVAVDSAGNVYVADASNHVIRKITSAGVTSTVAGLAGTLGTADGSGGVGGAARFKFPAGIAVSANGNFLYVADTSNHTIRVIDITTPASPVVSTLSGSAGVSGSADGTAVNTLARFNFPQGLTVVGAGAGTTLYVADTSNQSIRKITIAGATVTTLAGPDGSSGNVPGTPGGIATATGPAARFNNPFAVAADATNVYVADKGNHTIRQVVIGTGVVTVLAGTGASGPADSPSGPGTSAQFNGPGGIALDSAGTSLYVADSVNNAVRKIVIASGIVTTPAGGIGLAAGFADGVGTAARFSGPLGIAVDSAGSFYVGDTNNQLIRKAAPAVAPAIGSVNNTTFTVSVAATPFSVTATGSPASTFTIVSGVLPSGVTLTSNAGLNTATLAGTPTVAGSFPFTIQASNGVGTAATQAFTLTVQQIPLITSAASTAFSVNTAGTFQVTASGSPAPTFSVIGTLPSGVATLSLGGLLTAAPPSSTSGSPYDFTIRATNTAGTNDQAFRLTVQNGASISVQPLPQTVALGATAVFSITAGGTPAPNSYQWYRQPNGGSFALLSDGGPYSGSTTASLTVSSTTLLMSGDLFQCVVSNGIGVPVTSGTALLTVTQVPVITSAGAFTFVVNQAGSFQVVATGSPTPTFSITAGTLPSSVATLSSTGLLSTTGPSSTTGAPFAFTITATNAGGTVNQSFSLDVSPTPLTPQITTQPTTQSIGLGQSAVFTVVATGTPAPTYQWQRQPVAGGGFVNLTDTGSYSGSTTATLTVANTTTGMNGDQFQVVLTNTQGTTTSAVAQITLTIGTTFTTFAGQALVAGANDATGSAAHFRSPTSVAVDSTGNVYVADASNHVIRKITSAGVVTTLAGLAGTSGTTDEAGSAARFNTPSGVALDSSANIYVADSGNHVIRKITPAGLVSTVAGLAGTPGIADGVGNTARFAYPAGVAVDSFGTVYVADTLNHAIRKITAGGVVITFAGLAGTSGTANGTGNAARFSFPNAVAVDAAFNVYVADTLNHMIRKITPGGLVTTLAGLASTSGIANGNGTTARFNQPEGIALDSSANVYVADTFSHTIRKITPTGDVTTLAGQAATSGFTDGSGTAARFNSPYGIAVDSSGNIYVADTFNHTIRRSGVLAAPQVTLQPANQSAVAGANAIFTAAATGSPTPSYQWQRQPAGLTGFTDLVSSTTYSGVNSAALTVVGVTADMAGDQFQAVVSNLVSPNATTSAATLTLIVPPVFTSAASATFNTGQASSFTVTATSTPAATFTSTTLPAGLTLNATTGVISGTPTSATGSPFTITLTASNGATINQTFTLTIVVPVVAPTIATQPVTQAVNRGANATFTVAAGGTAPFTYQWSKNGIPVTGATGASFSLIAVQPVNSGDYTVTVTNSVSSVTSSVATLAVNAPPTVSAQPLSQTVIASNPVTFSVTATAVPAPTYQWRLNGTAIAGATGSTYTVTSAQAANAGNYDVVITNSGTQGTNLVVSSIAQLTVVSAATAPVITSQPVNRTALLGTSATLAVGASGAPAPTYQWRKNGTAISGATASTLTFGSAQLTDAGNYDVVISNAAGSVLSGTASLGVISRSYAGTYFGSFGGSLGNFALYIRTDNTGVFIGYLPGTNIAVKNLSFTVSDAGVFSFTQTATGGIVGSGSPGDEGVRAAAPGDIVFAGSIATDGTLGGSVTGIAGAALAATKAADGGATQAVAGFYQASATNGSATELSVVGGGGQAFVLTQNTTTSDGGAGTVDANGRIAIVTTKSIISATVNADASTISGTASVGTVVTTYTGASEAVLATQRLGNISTRARVGTGSGIVIAGFIISGTDSKPVLIRAIGPSLVGQGVATAISAPKLDLYRGNTVLATNSGWASAGNTAAIVAASVQAGAFPLSTTSADSVIFTTLPPGAYTAQVSSANGSQGVALVEVYDLSAAAAGQKLFNISTLATAGAGDNTLIAGFVVNGVVPKRVLIRAVGPGLVQLGLSGVLAQPTLQLIKDNVVVAQNTGWGTSPDASAIAVAAAQVGAFTIIPGSGDSAMIVSLTPGSYSATVVAPNGTSGIAIVEVYELP